MPSGLLPDMNILLIDAQGMEFEILMGMAAALAPPSSSTSSRDSGTGFEAAVVEVSHVSVYEVRILLTIPPRPSPLAHPQDFSTFGFHSFQIPALHFIPRHASFFC